MRTHPSKHRVRAVDVWKSPSAAEHVQNSSEKYMGRVYTSVACFERREVGCPVAAAETAGTVLSYGGSQREVVPWLVNSTAKR